MTASKYLLEQYETARVSGDYELINWYANGWWTLELLATQQRRSAAAWQEFCAIARERISDSSK